MSEFDTSRVAQAIKTGTPLPAMPSGLSLDDAYALQLQTTALINRSQPVGWKAGVTNAEMQAAFGLSEPLIGSLYRGGQLHSPASLELTEDHLIECEVCVVVGPDWRPKYIAPAIEFVRLTFALPSDLTPANVVAANVGADRFLVGDLQDFEAVADVPVTVEKNGERLLDLSSGIDRVTIEQRVEWMRKAGSLRCLARSDEEDHLLLLGTMGQTIKAAPGKYRAAFGSLGTVEFDILQR